MRFTSASNVRLFEVLRTAATPRRFVAVMTLALASCSDAPAPQRSAFEAGVEVLEASECQESAATRGVVLTKRNSDHVVDIVSPGLCGAELAAPYLMPVIDGKTKLILRERSSAVLNSGCECMRSLKIKISDRFEVGETLYVTQSGEVVGHVVVD